MSQSNVDGPVHEKTKLMLVGYSSEQQSSTDTKTSSELSSDDAIPKVEQEVGRILSHLLYNEARKGMQLSSEDISAKVTDREFQNAESNQSNSSNDPYTSPKEKVAEKSTSGLIYEDSSPVSFSQRSEGSATDPQNKNATEKSHPSKVTKNLEDYTLREIGENIEEAVTHAYVKLEDVVVDIFMKMMSEETPEEFHMASRFSSDESYDIPSGSSSEYDVAPERHSSSHSANFLSEYQGISKQTASPSWRGQGFQGQVYELVPEASAAQRGSQHVYDKNSQKQIKHQTDSNDKASRSNLEKATGSKSTKMKTISYSELEGMVVRMLSSVFLDDIEPNLNAEQDEINVSNVGMANQEVKSNRADQTAIKSGGSQSMPVFTNKKQTQDEKTMKQMNSPKTFSQEKTKAISLSKVDTISKARAYGVRELPQNLGKQENKAVSRVQDNKQRMEKQGKDIRGTKPDQEEVSNSFSYSGLLNHDILESVDAAPAVKSTRDETPLQDMKDGGTISEGRFARIKVNFQDKPKAATVTALSSSDADVKKQPHTQSAPTLTGDISVEKNLFSQKQA